MREEVCLIKQLAVSEVPTMMATIFPTRWHIIVVVNELCLPNTAPSRPDVALLDVDVVSATIIPRLIQ